MNIGDFGNFHITTDMRRFFKRLPSEVSCLKPIGGPCTVRIVGKQEAGSNIVLVTLLEVVYSRENKATDYSYDVENGQVGKRDFKPDGNWIETTYDGSCLFSEVANIEKITRRFMWK